MGTVPLAKIETWADKAQAEFLFRRREVKRLRKELREAMDKENEAIVFRSAMFELRDRRRQESRGY